MCVNSKWQQDRGPTLGWNTECGLWHMQIGLNPVFAYRTGERAVLRFNFGEQYVTDYVQQMLEPSSKPISSLWTISMTSNDFTRRIHLTRLLQLAFVISTCKYRFLTYQVRNGFRSSWVRRGTADETPFNLRCTRFPACLFSQAFLLCTTVTGKRVISRVVTHIHVKSRSELQHITENISDAGLTCTGASRRHYKHVSTWCLLNATAGIIYKGPYDKPKNGHRELNKDQIRIVRSINFHEFTVTYTGVVGSPAGLAHRRFGPTHLQ